MCRIETKFVRDENICLSPVSKDLRGELRLLDRDLEECPDLKCKTLKAEHALELDVVGHKPCDKPPIWDGRLKAKLVHAFVDGSGNNRGLHAGDFSWEGPGFQIRGTLSGVTNAGTHREPAFDKCQECYAPGYMEGRLCGQVLKSKDPKFVGCQVFAVYRLRFDPSESGGEGGVKGTLEGLTVCQCKDGKKKCIDFQVFPLGAGPNPRNEAGATFEVFDFAGNLTPTSDIVQIGAFHGLNVNFQTRVFLPTACSSVDVTLVHFSQPAGVTGINSDGTTVGPVGMSGPGNVAETLTLNGGSIERLIVKAPQNETLLLKLCYTPL